MCEYVRSLSRNYATEQMSRWLTHWDYQLYKALEAGYRMGLESLNENLGEIRADLIYAPGAKTVQASVPNVQLRGSISLSRYDFFFAQFIRSSARLSKSSARPTTARCASLSPSPRRSKASARTLPPYLRP